MSNERHPGNGDASAASLPFSICRIENDDGTLIVGTLKKFHYHDRVLRLTLDHPVCWWLFVYDALDTEPEWRVVERSTETHDFRYDRCTKPRQKASAKKMEFKISGGKKVIFTNDPPQ